MKHAFRLSRARVALVALLAVATAVAAAVLTAGAGAQTLPSSTPDTAIFQITSTTIPGTPTPTPSPLPTPGTTPTPTPLPIPRDSFAGDISGNGRFVVIESAGDIATDRTADRNNVDGNQEIFLFDYAQRRIFQITNTKSALKDTAKSSLDATNIDVQIVNLKPSLSRDGKFIVFQSNAYVEGTAANPKNFDGQANAAALKAVNQDGTIDNSNTEIFVYALPAFAEVADLSQGTEVPTVELSAGVMTRVTTTKATAAPRAAGTNFTAFFALDNYDPIVNDDGSLVAFVSKARAGNIGTGNADGNKEIFVAKLDLSGAPAAVGVTSITQVTATTDVIPAGSVIPTRFVFNEAPALSACTVALGCRLAYISNADANTDEAEANRGNGEIFAASLNPASGAVQSTRQVTRTPPETRIGAQLVSVNILSPGRRVTRDGSRIVFETTAVFNSDGSLNGALANSYGIYIANVSAASTTTFEQVGARPPATQADLPTRWPTFTGDSSRVVWASNLNYNADGTISTTTGQGLNQNNLAQIFSAPVGALTTVSRVTNLSTGSGIAGHAAFSPLQPFPSDNLRRMAISLRSEQGSGNPDASSEAFYQLIPVVTSETPAPSPTPAASPAPVSFFTGASQRAVVAPSPSPTPPDVTGLAPGMLGIARSTLTLAPGTLEVDRNNAHQTQRRPPLPVELSGVTVTVSGAAAGLYFAGPNQINFVVPTGLANSATASPVVINNNGSLIRTSLLLNIAQPDIFTSTNGAGGRAAVVNVTNPCILPPGEPFSVTTTRPAGSGATGNCASPDTETAATQLLIMLTGVRNITLSATTTITVRIGTTDIISTDASNPIRVGPSNTPGFDQITVTLPASLANAGDVPVIVTVTTPGGTFTSRPAETAPRITIQ